jgi:hypothetical protein
MEDRSTPSAAAGTVIGVPTATVNEPLLVAHVTPLQMHAFNPQPDPPAVVFVGAGTWAG